MIVVGPDGQPVAVPADAVSQAHRGRGRRRPARAHRPGRAAGEGDADRQHDPAAARGGEVGAARRRQPQPAQGDPPLLDQGARERAGARAGRGAGAAVAAVHRGRHARRTPSCGSPRPSWSAGSRDSSTASRPRSTPSRSRRVRSSSRCVAPCRASRLAAFPGSHPGRPASRTSRRPSRARAGCISRETPGRVRSRSRRGPGAPHDPPPRRAPRR